MPPSATDHHLVRSHSTLGTRTAPFTAMAVGGVASFVLLAAIVHTGLAQELDEAALAWVRELRTDPITTAMLRLTALGYGVTVLVIAGCSGVMLIIARQTRAAMLVVLSTGGGMLLHSALKVMIGRPRPAAADWLAHATMPSFPSGHAANGTCLFLSLLVIVNGSAISAGVRWVAVTAFVILALLIAGSRPYLGVHYPLDVLAGIALGIAWVGASGWLVTQITHRFDRVPMSG